MNDERARWALERLAKRGNVIARWALERGVSTPAKRDLDEAYASTFKLRRDR